MWLKVLNQEQSLLPQLEASFGALSHKEEKLMKILDFAEIETFFSAVEITKPQRQRRDAFAHLGTV